MRKRKYLILIFVAALLLSACSRHISSYKAIGLNAESSNDHCSVQFRSLTGRYVLQTKKTGSSEGTISYSIQLEEGEINIYYDALGVKELLCSAKAGAPVTGVGGYVERGKRIYIIIETVTPARGSVTVDIVG